MFNILIALGALSAFAFVALAYEVGEPTKTARKYSLPTQENLSRGYRNNNPLNIRISNNNWKGKIPIQNNTDGSFEQFESPEYGYRAAIKNILNYDTHYGVNTLSEIIGRWAPEHGYDPKDGIYTNETNAYIEFVSKHSGIEPYQAVNHNDVAKVVYAMSLFENAPPHPHSLATANAALRLL